MCMTAVCVSAGSILCRLDTTMSAPHSAPPSGKAPHKPKCAPCAASSISIAPLACASFAIARTSLTTPSYVGEVTTTALHPVSSSLLPTSSGATLPKKLRPGTVRGMTYSACSFSLSTALKTERCEFRAASTPFSPASDSAAKIAPVLPLTDKNARRLPHSAARRSVSAARTPCGALRSSNPSISVMSKAPPSGFSQGNRSVSRLCPGICMGSTFSSPKARSLS